MPESKSLLSLSNLHRKTCHLPCLSACKACIVPTTKLPCAGDTTEHKNAQKSNHVKKEMMFARTSAAVRLIVLDVANPAVKCDGKPA